MGSATERSTNSAAQESARGAVDAPSFEAVYDAHAEFVWRAARRLGVAPSALEDVFQEIFLVVHRRLGDFEARSSVRTWLYGITVHVVRRHRRTLQRKPSHLTADGELEHAVGAAQGDAAIDGPHEAAAKREAVRVLHEILDQLDDDKREVFVLAELEQMPAHEIGDALALNPNTVQSRLRAARQAFEQALARHHARDRWRLGGPRDARSAHEREGR